MFQIKDFSSGSDDDDVVAQQQDRQKHSSKAAVAQGDVRRRRQQQQQPARAVSGYHRPGDAAFSAVAVPPAHLLAGSDNAAKAKAQEQELKSGGNNSNNNNNNNNNSKKNGKKKSSSFSGNDEHGVGSATWATTQCRCLRCELLRASEQWSSGTNRTASNKSGSGASENCILVLVDADNFGFKAFNQFSPTLFRHFKQQQQQQSKQDASVAQAAAKIFVWAFYGACFQKHHQVDLETYVESTTEGAENAKGASAAAPEKFKNTWHLLKHNKSVLCTRCSGAPQAADLVCEAVAAAVADEEQNVRVALLTCDKGLRKSVADVWAERDPASYFIPECHQWTSEQVWAAILGRFPAATTTTTNESALSSVVNSGKRRQRAPGV